MTEYFDMVSSVYFSVFVLFSGLKQALYTNTNAVVTLWKKRCVKIDKSQPYQPECGICVFIYQKTR